MTIEKSENMNNSELSSGGTTRVQLNLPERSMSRLLWLKTETESSTYLEVTKNSFRLYELMIKYAKDGNSFQLKSKDGTVKDLEIFL